MSNLSSLEQLHNELKVLVENMEFYQLSNGLKVLLYKDVSRPKILLQLAYNVGSSIEKSFEKGLAHLVEHMIFKGTQKLAEGDIDAIARKYGANFNAFTSHDVTSYYFETGKANWYYFLDILADCMINSRFDSDHLASELKAVVQELNLFKDDYDVKMAEKAIELLFPANHPYHYPIIGFKEELAKLSADQLKDFYKKYYHPSKATLFVVGDIDVDVVKQEIDKLFSKIENPSKIIEPSFPALIESLSVSNVQLFEKIEQRKLCFFWRVPGLDGISTALMDVVSEVLAGGPNSRLYKALVDKTELARSVQIQVDLMHRSGVVFLFVVPTDDQRDIEIETVIREQLELLSFHGFELNEIDRAKQGLALSFIRKTESWHGLVGDWINEIILTNDPARIFFYLSELNRVSIEECRDVVQSYFLLTRLNLVSLEKLPEKHQSSWIKNQKIIKLQEEEILANHQRLSSLEVPTYVDQLPAPLFLPYVFAKPDFDQILDCGLSLISYRKKAYPITFFRLSFKDSFILSKSKEGLVVDLMMQMLLEKSEKFSKYQNLNFLEDLGAHFNFDADGVFVSVLATNFPSVLTRILEIFIKPCFEEEDLEKQKQILVADIYERLDDPQKIGIKAFYNKYFAGTEFDWTYEQAIDILQNITLEDLSNCHQKYCNVNALMAVVSGEFDLNDVSQIMNSAFSKNSASFSFQIPVVTCSDRFDLQIPLFRDQVTLFLVQPNQITILDPEYLELSLLNIILFYSLGSRLYKIREQAGLFYSLLGGFALDITNFGSIDYICTSLNVEDQQAALDAIFYELNLAKNSGITEKELSDAKQIYLNNLISMFADTPSVAQVFLSLKQFNLGFDYYDKILKRLETVSADDISKVAKKRILSESFSVISVGPV